MRTRRVQDKAWAIDLHLVKHSGMGKAAAVLGGEKVDLVGSNPLCFHFFPFFRTHLATHLGAGLASFRHEDDCSFLGIGYASIADSEVLGGGWLSVGFQHFREDWLRLQDLVNPSLVGG